MALHVIPDTETELHKEDPDCSCEPKFVLDEGSGEMVWLHKILDYERIIDELFKD